MSETMTLERLIDPPATWPLRWRRAYAAGFIVTAPLLFLLKAGLLLAGGVWLACALVREWLAEMWSAKPPSSR